MYNKVHLSIRLPNGITQSFSSNIGLKQGCNQSPILFNIFINDLNEIFDETFCQPAKIKNLTLNNLLYADDLVLVSETSSGLQNCLDRLQEYCDKWRLTVNIKKTKLWQWKSDNPQSTKPALLTKIMFLISVSTTPILER